LATRPFGPAVSEGLHYGAHPGDTVTAHSIPAQVMHNAGRLADDIALNDSGRDTSYRELASEIEETGRALMAAGVEHGDRISVWAPNSTRWIVAALAAQSVGAALVPINTRYKTLEAVHPLTRTSARMLIAAGGFMGVDPGRAIAEAEASSGQQIRLIDLGAADDDTTSWETLLAGADAVDPEEWRARLDAVGPDDLSDIMFTSGSTGLPKGVRHRHGPTMRQTFNTTEENGIREGDRLLIVNPFFHVFGYTGGWVPGLFAGGTVYPMAVFDVDEVLDAIEREQITYFPGPPTIFHSILTHPRLMETDVSSLRASLTGSADVPVDLIQDMLDELTFERVIQAYGMTECGTATNTIAADNAETVATTVGKASKDLEVRVVDPHNRPVVDGDDGEIVVRGYAVMDGYWDDPEATAATIDEDGWLHTGDRGSRDDNGYFRILGRIKDMYIVGGFNVYPAEVENMIREHPGVDDVAVIGVPDQRLGEVGCAFVVPATQLDEEQFVAWCRERMANFKVPRHVEILEVFPLTGSNKVSKVELRALAEQREIGWRDGGTA